MTVTQVSVRSVAGAVKARLDTVTHADGYVSEAKDVALIPDSDGRAAPYWVFHPGAGDPAVEPDLGDTAVELDWGFQVTCAAGVTEDLLALVDRVNAALFRWEPNVAGLVCGPLRVPPGYRPPVLLDRTVTPHRPYVALQFVTTITSA